MKVIGITGGVGAGKSFILEHLEENFSVEIVLTDDLAKELMMPETECNRALQDAFSSYDVFDSEGNIVRDKMASVIFSNQDMLTTMNSIVHPAVKAEVIRKIAKARADKKISAFFVESALLIDDHYDEICDELWYIFTSEENRRARLKATRGYSDEKVDAIFASQLSEDEFRANTDVVIDNNKDKPDVVKQIDQEMIRLLKEGN